MNINSHKITFNKPLLINNELDYINDAILNKKHISGDGYYTGKSRQFLKKYLNANDVLITHSCTAALEMAAILLNIKNGDEIIMPSFTFVSTANAFVLRGAVPVFVDIREDNLNLNEDLIEDAITQNTKAIVVVHYGGVSCDMDKVMTIAKKHGLYVIEDAAQALGSEYKGRKLGTIGHMGCLSFHETKNIISGEGGALIINDTKYLERAEIIREKGTNRTQFLQGQVDKYTWVDIGSSYLPSEIIAAYLFSQLENIDKINTKRNFIWDYYHQIFSKYVQNSDIRILKKIESREYNGHLFYVLFIDNETRNSFIKYMKDCGIMVIFHYVPLHSSPAGIKYGKTPFKMDVTNHTWETLVRMPLYYDLTQDELIQIEKKVDEFFIKK
jgi:dTDP-4-amino-4,6-dideoxygalactose transaminase